MSVLLIDLTDPDGDHGLTLAELAAAEAADSASVRSAERLAAVVAKLPKPAAGAPDPAVAAEDRLTKLRSAHTRAVAAERARR